MREKSQVPLLSGRHSLPILAMINVATLILLLIHMCICLCLCSVSVFVSAPHTHVYLSLSFLCIVFVFVSEVYLTLVFDFDQSFIPVLGPVEITLFSDFFIEFGCLTQKQRSIWLKLKWLVVFYISLSHPLSIPNLSSDTKQKPILFELLMKLYFLATIHNLR